MSSPPPRPAASAALSPVNRAAIVDQRFVEALEALAAAAPPEALAPPIRAGDEPLVPGLSLTVREALRCFEAQVASRHLDLEARAMKARGECFYTIGSSGHEANACVAAALRPTDPALLHYRSGPFFLRRAAQVPAETPLFDVLLGLAASREEPIAGGRHKVWGSASLAIPPQTSTIASHLPKALGLAVAIERARRLELAGRYPPDAVVCASFGDASMNHATAQAAFQAAGWLTQQRLPAPVLFVCEDNGIGISVPTPRGWVCEAMRLRPGIRYLWADGGDLAATYEAAQAAAVYVRETRRPAFLHLAVERLLGHAGSDVESTYRTLDEIAATEARDPLLRVARQLVLSGAATARSLLALYEETRARVGAAAREAARRPRLETVEEVVRPLAPRDPARVRAEAVGAAPAEARARAFGGGELPEAQRPRHMAVLIGWALRDLFARYPEALLFGEDVGRKGGVYHVTDGLQRAFGRARVFDTLLDETTILGLAMGAGMQGLLPCPEIQYLAYIHNALDQLRGEACSMTYFSQGAFENPMVVRVASLAYQKGFGGHFHNDTSTAALRDIPGLIVACPSRGDDAAAMLRTAFAAARVQKSVVCFLEPIALYMRKDLLPGDGAWQFAYPAPTDDAAHVPIGEARLYDEGARDGADLLLIAYGNGVPIALVTARRLAEEAEGAGARARVRVLDLRWLQPLDERAIVEEARAAGRRVVMVCEGRRAGGVAEPVLALLAEHLGGEGLVVERVTGADTYLPLGQAAELCLPSEESVLAAARRVLARPAPGAAR